MDSEVEFELDALRRRLDRQAQEIAELRELLLRAPCPGGVPPEADQAVATFPHPLRP